MEQYCSENVDSRNTSINTRGNSPSPAIVWLYENGFFDKAKTILDYGAGKFSRNADYLRDKGFDVYAYDPFNGKEESGWEKGKVSNTLPETYMRFDIGLSVYVLNVVPKFVEDEILADLERMCVKSYNVVRDDIIKVVEMALEIKKGDTYEFYQKFLLLNKLVACNKEAERSNCLDFCRYGFKTSRGFQRLVETPENFETVYLKKSNYKIFSNRK